ncbi:hypothetical protein [Helicobacter canis]|uniref:hypothetical protein n=1 Tax=Helicobacter canis TaxID=29419 RepID=UPI000417375B|nr:hypothetical protein [Helicobacter canis]
MGDKNGALQGGAREHTRAYVTADPPQQSPFLAPKPAIAVQGEAEAGFFRKPTPKPQK